MECDAFRDDMLEVLYGEADAATAKRFQEHQSQCGACRAELTAFRRVRRDLSAWKVPDLPLAAPTNRRGAARGLVPSYLAVAAGLVLALGGALGLSGSEFRYQDGRFSFRLGRAASQDEIRAMLQAEEERHRQELQDLQRSVRAVPTGEDVLLDRMQRMIEASEARQASRADENVARLRSETQAQRRYDLAQVGAGLSYLEGQTGLQMARQTELMGHVLQAAQKK